MHGRIIRRPVRAAGSTAHNPAAATVVAAGARWARAYWWYVGARWVPAAAGGARRNASYFRPRVLVAATAAALLLSAPAALADTVVSGGPQGTTTDATPTFTFTGEAGSTFECKIDPPGEWKPCASPYSVSLADGAYTFSVRATDAAGNVEANPPVRAFTVDTSQIET